MPEPGDPQNKVWKYFTYPADGTRKALPIGKTRIDFYTGKITLPDGTEELMLTSLEEQGDVYVRSANIEADEDVIAWLDDGSKTPIPASDYWILTNVSFKTLWIETTKSTNTTVWASTDPNTSLQRTKSQASKRAKQQSLIAQNKRFVNVTSPTSNTLRGVWLESLSLGFSVGNAGTILKYDGNVWISMTSPTATQLNKVASDTPGVTAPNTKGAWAIGQSGVIVNYDTSTETWALDAQSGAITTQHLNGILIYDINSLMIAVGANGTIIGWDGTTWSVVTSGTAQVLRGIAWDDNLDLWICGDNGTLLKSTDSGVTWFSVPSGVTKRLNYIWFTASRDKGYAVGEDGTILKIIPSTNTVSVIPTELPTGTGSMLNSIEITSESSGFLVGNSGNILYWDGDDFYEVSSPTQYALADAAGTSVNVVFAVGVDGTILKLMAETYGTTIESRGTEITPLKEEHEETRIFTDEAITDTNAHNSSILNAGRYKYITFYISNTHNQALTIQVNGNRTNSTTGAVTIGTSFSVAATSGKEARTLLIENDGYLPYYFITATASIAPTSGNVNAYAIGRN